MEKKKSPDRKNHIVNAIPSDETWIGSRKKNETAFLARASWQQRIEEAIFSRQTPPEIKTKEIKKIEGRETRRRGEKKKKEDEEKLRGGTKDELQNGWVCRSSSGDEIDK